jgi:hypothetical protein
MQHQPQQHWLFLEGFWQGSADQSSDFRALSGLGFEGDNGGNVGHGVLRLAVGVVQQ